MLLAKASCGDDGVLDEPTAWNVKSSSREGDDENPIYRFRLCGALRAMVPQLTATASVHDNVFPLSVNLEVDGDVTVALRGGTSSVSIQVQTPG